MLFFLSRMAIMRFLPLAGHSWRHCRQEPGFDSPWRCGGGTASLLERAPVVVEPFFRCCVAAGQVNSPPPFHPISPPLTPPQRAPRPFPNSLPLPTTLTTPHRACWQAITATQAPIPVALIVLGAACEVSPGPIRPPACWFSTHRHPQPEGVAPARCPSRRRPSRRPSRHFRLAIAFLPLLPAPCDPLLAPNRLTTRLTRPGWHRCNPTRFPHITRCPARPRSRYRCAPRSLALHAPLSTALT